MAPPTRAHCSPERCRPLSAPAPPYTHHQALGRQGQHAAAEGLLWEALEARRAALGPEHPSVAALEEQLRGSLAAQCAEGPPR